MAITSFTPSSGPPGTLVTLTQASTAGLTAIDLNGTPCLTWYIVSGTSVKVLIPRGATSGKWTSNGETHAAGTQTVTNPAI